MNKSKEINQVKVKDLEKVFESISKKTGKTPHLKGKGSGYVKLGFN